MADTQSPIRRTRGIVPIWVYFVIGNCLVLLIAASLVVALWPEDTTQETEGSQDRDDSEIVAPDLKDKPARPRTTADVVADVKRGVVLITTYNSAGDKIGLGTGFVIDPSGLIGTNFHVLRGASSADAEFFDRAKTEIKGVRAWDLASDLAILDLKKLPADCPVLELSTETERQNADDVLSIGHPQEFKFTTTTGIISAVHRTSDLPAQFQQSLNAPADHMWLQTTAAISGGSSGGPLLNHDGVVIGMNTWVSGNYSFAIDARHLIELKQNRQKRSRSLADLTGPDEKLAQLLTEFQQKAQWFNVELARATSQKQRQRIIEASHPAPQFASRLQELAKNSRGAPVEFDALQWLCRIASQPGSPNKCNTSLRAAADLLVERHLEHPRLIDLVWTMRGRTIAGSRQLVQRIAEASSDRDLQGIAYYCAALSGKQSESEPAIELLNKVVKQYNDVIYHCSDPRHPQHQIGDEAKEALFRLEHLVVGRKALDIVGKDLADREFKLSDFRGKVVLLDFWADWCPPCKQMLPHERELVEELKDEPFALLGVYMESTPELEEFTSNNSVTWQNWIDGKSGPIASQWRIASLPTLFVLDHEGVIRHQAVGYTQKEQLEKWIKDLLEKVPATEAR